MSQMLQDQIAKLHDEAQACREVASHISLRVAAESLLETARAFDRQAALLERLREKEEKDVGAIASVG
ncbi:hypothetical protein [Muricoccus vinaceus]|uniref:Uncharacterized protein n=1 Tax=Muricoccus vinaceus TaxID=424704 RepID=A0ABV6J1Z6_9PROT